MKKIAGILFLLSTLIFLNSCEDEKYMNSTEARLVFSVDTVRFDTIFTTVGSTTQHLKVYNPYSQPVMISRIKLSGGDNSKFRLNINGIPAGELFDVPVPANDSIYIFVEVTIDPLGGNLPIVVKDSIEFVTNTNQQKVLLEAWGQDINIVRESVRSNTTWTADKPYVVYANTLVDSKATLTVKAGSRVYFHKGTGLYVKGKLQVNGTFEKPVIFQADRLEDAYKNIPDQWNGIFLYSGSHDNEIKWSEIKNANIGLQVGNIENEGYASVNIQNTKIYNHSYAGIFALKSKVAASNVLIANCGYYGAALLIGGEYEFYHTTIANYWGGYNSRSRSTPSVMVSDHVVVEQSGGSKITYKGDLTKAFFGNSIVTGNAITGNELELARLGSQTFNFRFEHCLLQLADTFNVSNPKYYRNILKNGNVRFVDPYVKMNFQLDTLSAAKDAGAPEIGSLFPLDLLNQNRTKDAAPDLGAYERQEQNSK